jgi:hypothetical protein
MKVSEVVYEFGLRIDGRLAVGREYDGESLLLPKGRIRHDKYIGKARYPKVNACTAKCIL